MTLLDYQGWLFLLFNCDFLITEEMFVLFPASDRSLNLPSLLQFHLFSFIFPTLFYLLVIFACFAHALASVCVLQRLSICICFIQSLIWAVWFYRFGAAANLQSLGWNCNVLFMKMRKDLWWETAQRETGDKEERCSHLCLEAQILFQTKAVWALSGKGVELWLWAG